MILKKRGWMRIKEGKLSAWIPQEGTLLFSVFTTDSRLYSKIILLFLILFLNVTVSLVSSNPPWKMTLPVSQHYECYQCLQLMKNDCFQLRFLKHIKELSYVNTVKSRKKNNIFHINTQIKVSRLSSLK